MTPSQQGIALDGVGLQSIYCGNVRSCKVHRQLVQVRSEGKMDEWANPKTMEPVATKTKTVIQKNSATIAYEDTMPHEFSEE